MVYPFVKTECEAQNQCAPGSTLSELLSEPDPTNMVGVEIYIRVRIRKDFGQRLRSSNGALAITSW